MLNYYTARHHELCDELAVARRQVRILDDRAASLLRTATNLEETLRVSRRGAGRLMLENARLVELVIDITRDIDPVLARQAGTRLVEITAPQFQQYDVIDLTADEDLQ